MLFLLYSRSQKRGFHLPGGDGSVVMLAGGWTVLLLVWRLFDKPQWRGRHRRIDWGIFVALLAAGTLTWAGVRMRAAHRPEPPLPLATEEDDRPRSPAAGRRRPGSRACERTPDRRPHTAPHRGPLGEPTDLALDDPPAYEPPRRSR